VLPGHLQTVLESDHPAVRPIRHQRRQQELRVGFGGGCVHDTSAEEVSLCLAVSDQDTEGESARGSREFSYEPDAGVLDELGMVEALDRDLLRQVAHHGTRIVHEIAVDVQRDWYVVRADQETATLDLDIESDRDAIVARPDTTHGPGHGAIDISLPLVRQQRGYVTAADAIERQCFDRVGS
jgi:hypothetical protein